MAQRTEDGAPNARSALALASPIAHRSLDLRTAPERRLDGMLQPLSHHPVLPPARAPNTALQVRRRRGPPASRVTSRSSSIGPCRARQRARTPRRKVRWRGTSGGAGRRDGRRGRGRVREETRARSPRSPTLRHARLTPIAPRNAGTLDYRVSSVIPGTEVRAEVLGARLTSRGLSCAAICTPTLVGDPSSRSADRESGAARESKQTTGTCATSRATEPACQGTRTSTASLVLPDALSSARGSERTRPRREGRR